MKITISEKDKSLLVLLAALIILSVSYFGIYQGNMHKTEALREENAELERKAAILEDKVARKEEVLADTVAKRELTSQIISKLPAAQTTQNAIYILDNLENIVDFDIFSESFLMNADFWQSENVEPEMKGYCSKVTISYATSYEGLKEALEFFENNKDRITVTDVSAAYSTATGELTGTMTIAMYSMTGTERTYSDPVIGDIRFGVSNILRTGPKRKSK